MKQEVNALLLWYEENKRNLPWRKDKNPYHIWISEIMLQQTRVEQVKEYYQTFMKTLPTIQDLANVEEDKLMKLWEGLGYYSRAKNIQKTAKIITSKEAQKFPRTYEELLKLPGIGPYTAGAIASICYNEKTPAVDGNVIRVMLRLKNDRTKPDDEALKKKLFYELERVMPKEAGDFNQALMDLGATVCIPKTYPLCHKCPLKNYCKAYENHNVINIPTPKKKTVKKVEKYTIVILECNNKFAIRKREKEKLLANLYEFYTISGMYSLPKLKKFLNDNKIEYKKIERLGSAKHIFTHKIWMMQGYYVSINKKIPEFYWVEKPELFQKYSIPTAFSKFKEQIEKIQS